MLAQPLFGDFDISFNAQKKNDINYHISTTDSLTTSNYSIFLDKNLMPSKDTDFQVIYQNPNNLHIIKDTWSAKYNEMFMTTVFAICFVGETFFIFIYLIYVRRKWLHIYLLMVITKHGMPIELSQIFKFD